MNCYRQMDAGATVTFQIDGNMLVLYRTLNTNRGVMEVCVDALPCELVDNYSATRLLQQPVTFTGLGAGVHTVQVSNTSSAIIDLDAVEAQ